MLDRRQLHQLVRELLTDYDDNFIGEPCEEVIEEIIEQMNELDTRDSSTVADAIDRIVG